MLFIFFIKLVMKTPILFKNFPMNGVFSRDFKATITDVSLVNVGLSAYLKVSDIFSPSSAPLLAIPLPKDRSTSSSSLMDTIDSKKDTL